MIYFDLLKSFVRIRRSKLKMENMGGVLYGSENLGFDFLIEVID